MTNILRAACLAGTIFSLSIVPGEAQSQSKEVKKEPVQATSPNSGSEMVRHARLGAVIFASQWPRRRAGADAHFESGPLPRNNSGKVTTFGLSAGAGPLCRQIVLAIRPIGCQKQGPHQYGSNCNCQRQGRGYHLIIAKQIIGQQPRHQGTQGESSETQSKQEERGDLSA